MEVTGKGIQPQSLFKSPRYSLNTISSPDPLRTTSAFKQTRSAQKYASVREHNQKLLNKSGVVKKDSDALSQFQSCNRSVNTAYYNKTLSQPRVIMDDKLCKHHSQCPRVIYKTRLCKKHYLDNVGLRVRKEFKMVYKDPEQSYASLDFTGIGRVSMRTFLDNMIVKRLKVPEEDLVQWLIRDKIFTDAQSDVDFQHFKKKFFPDYFLIEEVNEYDINGHSKTEEILRQGEEHSKQKEHVVQRLYELEQQLKIRFQNNWVSVRRAFLDLDYDHDGFVTSQDIIRYFRQASKDLDFNDLTKLMKDKDSKKKGWLSYADFSKWMGVAIHQSEGFYFRHDSIKNPPYEENLLKRYEQRVIPQKAVLSVDVEKTVIDKIHFQWKTLKKAFIDLNKEKTGSIMPQEFKNYLNHWGIYLTEDQFKLIFDKFDADKDGKITYEDFQNTVGNEINPPEHLYFRQDIRRVPRPVVCVQEECLQPPSGISEYCQMHIKMLQNKAIKIIQRLKNRLAKRWAQFVNIVRRKADAEDANLMYLDDLVGILSQKFGLKLSADDQMTLTIGFPAKSTDQKIKVNISHLISLNDQSHIRKLYKKIDLEEEFQEDAQFVDMSGYLGQFYRQNVKTQPIELDDFVKVIVDDNKLASVMRCIKDIDKDNNGYVTNQELDDILKLIYPTEFKDKDLKRLFRRFASIQNTILIDYKKLRDFLVHELKRNNKIEGTAEAVNPYMPLQSKPTNMISEESKTSFTSLETLERKKVDYHITPVSNAIKSSVPLYQQMFQSKHSFSIRNEKASTSVDMTQSKKKFTHAMFNRDRLREQIRTEIKEGYGLQGDFKSREATPARSAKTSYMNRRSSRVDNNTMGTELSIVEQSVVKQQQRKKRQPLAMTQTLKEAKLIDTLKATMHGAAFNTLTSTKSIKEPKKSLAETTREQDILIQNHDEARPQTSQGGAVKRGSRSSLKTQQGPRHAYNTLLQTLQEVVPSQQVFNQTDREGMMDSIRKQRLLHSLNRADTPLMSTSETSTQRRASTVNELRRILGQRKISALAGTNLNSAVAYNSLNKSHERSESRSKPRLFHSLAPKQESAQKDNLSGTMSTVAYSTSANKFNNHNGTPHSSGIKDRVRHKLAYEWKNVYRLLSQDECYSKGQGIVSLKQFESALSKTRVNLTKEELSHIFAKFGEERTSTINYTTLSKVLGFHSNQLELIRPTTSAAHSINQ